MPNSNLPAIRACRPAWNKGRLVGQKRPLLPKHVWCDLVKLKVSDVFSAGQVKERASITQSKTRHPVRFEITEGTRRSIAAWLDDPAMIGSEHLWPGRFHERLHISTRQYARLVRDWVSSIGLEPSSYGTHSMRRTKVAQIYRKTGNLRAVQLLLGHTKMDSTVTSASSLRTPWRYRRRWRSDRQGRPARTALFCRTACCGTASPNRSFVPFVASPPVNVADGAKSQCVRAAGVASQPGQRRRG
jgi:hypothetical protein